MKYKVLQEVFGEGYKFGEIIEREPHAMELHLNRGEVEVLEVVADVKPIVDKVEKIVDSECKKCGRSFKSERGLKIHSNTCGGIK